MIKKTLAPEEAKNAAVAGILVFTIIALVINLIPINQTENVIAVRTLINIISIPCGILLFRDMVTAIGKR